MAPAAAAPKGISPGIRDDGREPPVTWADTRFIPVGVILSVKPRASNDGITTMDVRVEVSNL